MTHLRKMMLEELQRRDPGDFLPGIVYGCLVTRRQPAGSADEPWSTPQRNVPSNP